MMDVEGQVVVKEGVAKMETILLGKTVDLKSHRCSLNGCDMEKIDEKYVNLYIQLKGCNAKCSFCEYKETAEEFNFDKLYDVLYLLEKESSNVKVNKISITGGEPTMNLKKLYKIVDLVKKFFPSAFLVMNTNGYKLPEMFIGNTSKYFDSISLSRHHYDDEKNNKILGFESISSKKLKAIQDLYWNEKDKLHLSCNLIKGSIDSEKEIYKYLEFANSVKINDVGFVSLMKINYFCNENFIDFSQLNFKSKRIFKTKEWKYFDSCKCNNYLYIPKQIDGDFVKVYSRHYCKPNTTSNVVVFNGENLKFGFNGLTLI